MRVVIDPEVFSQDFVPPAILHRETQMNSLKLMFSKGTANALLYGPPGTGKTTVAKYIAEELSKVKKLSKLYMNCWHLSTKSAVFNYINTQFGIVAPRRGISKEEQFESFIQQFPKTRDVFFILDEVDALKDGTLYDMLRLKEVYSLRASIVGVTNVPNFLTRLDARVRSSFSSAIEFPPYKPNELKDILRERAIPGLMPNAWNEDVIAKCAGFAAKYGDARMGISLLYNSALIAEQEEEKIKIEHVEKAKKQTLIYLVEAEKQQLGQSEKAILTLIESAGAISVSELYHKVKGLSERTVREILDLLEGKGFIVVENVNNKRVVRPRFKV
ncbi:MAG: Cdc6/Cdc18 family protein [Candidatus Anstonellales archaeon]